MAECKRDTETISTYTLELSHEEACAVWRVFQKVSGNVTGPRGLIDRVNGCMGYALLETVNDRSHLEAMFICSGNVAIETKPLLE